MKSTAIAIVGGGPAGICAAIAAARLGVSVVLVDDAPRLGGQLVKQTHKFFGDRNQYCGIRGMDIATILVAEAKKLEIELLSQTSVIGHYDQQVLALATSDRLIPLHYEKVVVATGAAENNVLFANNDLPGIYGAGAVQTLMNVYGVRPGRRVLLVGSGNIGLIVSYQLIQAGINVAAVVEALPKIGGYHVHAAKLARIGVPILTSHTIVSALGTERVTGAVIARVGPQMQPIPRTARRLRVDTICLAVGLTPLTELLWQIGCRMVHVPELGGIVAWHDENMQTSVPGVYVAGDVSGIEEASTAMLEGKIAGAHAAMTLTGKAEANRDIEAAKMELCSIRSGPFGEKASCGKARLAACK